MTVPGRELLHAPLGDIIRDVALAIADSQIELDAAAVRTAEYMSGRVVLRDPDTGALVDEQGEPTDVPTVASSEVIFGHDVDAAGRRVPRLVSMMELGFVPTFYQFVDTTIEIRLSVRLTGAGSQRHRYGSNGTTWGRHERSTAVHATTVDAGFASAYQYSAEMATKVSTKIVPIPPPAALEAQIAQLLADDRLDVNTATADELAALDALSPTLAQAVVDARPFASLDDLQRVAGIGPATVDQLRPHLRV